MKHWNNGTLQTNSSFGLENSVHVYFQYQIYVHMNIQKQKMQWNLLNLNNAMTSLNLSNARLL